MKKTIDMMAQLLEKNNIPLPYGEKKKDGGLNFENRERCHALVNGSSRYLSLNIYSSSSRNMDSIEDSFLTLHPCSGPSILMGDDFEIPTKGISRINLDNAILQQCVVCA